MESKSFGAVDMAVFIGILTVSLLVGIYYAIKDRHKKTIENYYFGERTLSPIPVGLSISVTYISALTVVGIPNEAYGYGTIWLWFFVPAILGNFVVCIYYVPLIRRLKVTSIFEYLELRFNKRIRILESVINNIQIVFYLGMAVYLPSLALSAVTPLGIRLNIIITSLVCTIYTTLGGMKAVVWTDTIQTFIMLIGMLAALIKATLEVGGMGNVWAALERGDRLTGWNFNPDPTLPYTVWTFVIGQTTLFCGLGSNQALCQRFLACKTLRDARIATAISAVLTTTFFVIAVLSGLVMYAYFEGCDPLESGQVEKKDQLMPYMVVSVFQTLPGMAGVFVSAAFSGTLSTVSSGINSAGALVLEDYIMPCWPKISEITKLTLSKIIVLFFGLLVTGFAICVDFVESTIMQLSFTIFGAISGPMLGMFTLAIFFPCCNATGAFVGQIVSTLLVGLMGMMALFKGRAPEKYEFLPTSTADCEWETLNSTLQPNYTPYPTTTSMSDADSVSYVTGFLALSHLYFAVLSLITTITIGMAVSYLTGANDPAKSDPKLFLPFIDNKLLPEKVTTFFRFGVPPYVQSVVAKVDGDDEEEEEKQDLCSEYDSDSTAFCKNEMDESNV